MTEEEFYADYFDGRKDFRNSDLKGIDFFTPILRRTHPEFFDKKLSNLVSQKSPVIHEPIDGVEFKEFDLKNASIMDTKLLRVGIILSSLRGLDGRFVSFLGSRFRDLDFTGADLRFSIFVGARISSTIFHDAKLDHAIFDLALIENTEFSNCSAVSSRIDRTTIFNSRFDRVDFTGTTIRESKINNSDLEGCNFFRSIFKSAGVSSCSFENCKISNAVISNSSFKECFSENTDYSLSKFISTNVCGSRFIYDSFSDSDFIDSRIINSNFESPSLMGSILNNTSIEDSNFISSILGRTSFIDMDLSFLLGRHCQHNAPSSIDDKSIAKTIFLEDVDVFAIDPHTELRKFLEMCGMAPIISMYLIDSIRACSKNQLREIMSSTFISYGSPDEDFAKKLNSDLTKYGVNTFFFPLDATFGEKLHSTMHRINDYDRTILVCSKDSLDRPGLLYELEKTIEREAREGGKSFLIPIALDDFVFSEWKPEREHLRSEILNRVVADFTEKDNYEKQFHRLLQSLDKLKNKQF